jgi:hypothetical protein
MRTKWSGNHFPNMEVMTPACVRADRDAAAEFSLLALSQVHLKKLTQVGHISAPCSRNTDKSQESYCLLDLS